MECCPTCHTPLDHREALAALATGGMTYREAAFAFGVSVKRIQNIVYERGLERRYRRIGRHPRRHAFITPGTFRELGQYLSRPRAHPAR
jgi:hypothetical protein